MDGSLVWESSVYSQHSSGNTVTGQCCCGVMGYNQGDLNVDFEVTVGHSSSNGTLRFTTNLDSAGDYWGVNDVQVSTVMSHPSPPVPPSPPGVWGQVANEVWPGATGWTSNVAIAETTCGDLGSMVHTNAIRRHRRAPHTVLCLPCRWVGIKCLGAMTGWKRRTLAWILMCSCVFGQHSSRSTVRALVVLIP